MPNRPPVFRWGPPPDRRIRDKMYELKRHADPSLNAAKRFRNSKRWQRFRDWFKRRHPTCCDPFQIHGDRPEPADHVHHIIGLTERLDLGLDETNCAGVCRHCHAKLEAQERHGKPTAGLFAAWQAQVRAEQAQEFEPPL